MALPRTVFILGAGASTHIDYPTGIQLRRKIVQNLNAKQGDLYERLQQIDGITAESLDRIRDIIYYSDFDTIDEVLVHHRENAGLLFCGKAAIAIELSRHELEAKLFGGGNPGWYRILFRFLHRNPRIVDEGSLSFITFNYDRSLDHYLERSLIHASHSNNAENRIINYLSKNLVHVHGQLGLLEWQTSTSLRRYRKYSQAMETREELMGIAGNIILPHETDPNAILHANGLLEHANTVCILGYGFHEANNQKVGLAKLRTMNLQKQVYATVKDPSASARQFLDGNLRPNYVLANIEECLNSVLNTYQS